MSAEELEDEQRRLRDICHAVDERCPEGSLYAVVVMSPQGELGPDGLPMRVRWGSNCGDALPNVLFQAAAAALHHGGWREG